jgi:hypothetical protein
VGLQRARSYLRRADPVLARLIDDRPAFDPRAWMAQLPPMDLYGALLFQVTGQQLSVPATRRTLARIQPARGALWCRRGAARAGEPGDPGGVVRARRPGQGNQGLGNSALVRRRRGQSASLCHLSHGRWSMIVAIS